MQHNERKEGGGGRGISDAGPVSSGGSGSQAAESWPSTSHRGAKQGASPSFDQRALPLAPGSIYAPPLREHGLTEAERMSAYSLPSAVALGALIALAVSVPLGWFELAVLGVARAVSS